MTVYLDNSATTRPCQAVVELANELLENGWFNPSALYKPAMDIQKRINQVREVCLLAAGASGNHILFTSGGTMKARKHGKVLISSVEHPAVSACADELRRMGHIVEEIPVGKDGTVDLMHLENI